MDSEIEKVAATAHSLCMSIRESDPRELFTQIATQCECDPERMAQVVMALAAWVPVDEPLSARGERVEAITMARLGIAS